MNKMASSITISLILALGVFRTATAFAATGDPVLINEILASHTGADDTESVSYTHLTLPTN